MDRAELEAWADQLLDQHRTAPKGAAAAGSEPVPDSELPPVMRLAKAIDPEWQIDRERFERLQRHAETQQRIDSVVSAVTVVGFLLLGGFLLFAFSAF